MKEILLDWLRALLWLLVILAILGSALYVEHWKIQVCEQSTGLNWAQCMIYTGGHH